MSALACILFGEFTHAACTSPAAIIGALDFQGGSFKYCDGTNWMALGGSASFPLLGSSGSAASPTYAFSAGTNTGMFMNGAGTLAFATGGPQRLTIGSTGYVGIGSSAPTVALDVLPPNGQYMAAQFKGSSSDDVVVHIGSASGSGQPTLEFKQPGYTAYQMFLKRTGGHNFYLNPGNDFNSPSSNSLVFTGSGELLLAAGDSPASGSRLDVRGGAISAGSQSSSLGGEIRWYEAQNGANYVGFRAPTSLAANTTWILPAANGSANQVLTTNAAGSLSWATAAGPWTQSASGSLTYTGGYVGIGTTTPTTKFQVVETTSNLVAADVTKTNEAYALTNTAPNYYPVGTAFQISAVDTPVDNGATLIQFSNRSVVGGYTSAFLGGVAGTITSGASHLVFGRRTGPLAWTESMRIDQSGNVGIGTNDPSDTLHIYKTGTGAPIFLMLENSQAAATNVGAQMRFKANNVIQSSINSGFTGGTNANAHLAFYTRGSGALTESVRIAGDGNVGIGSTSPIEKLTIDNSDSSIYAAAGTLEYAGQYGTSMRITNTSGINGSGAYVVVSAKNSSSLYGSGYFGAVSVSGASSRTPELVIGQRTGSATYAERIRIDTSGNVGIGTTSPISRLNVMNGAISAGSQSSTLGGEFRAYEAGNGANFSAFRAPPSLASDITYVLPAAAGTLNQVLATSAAGSLSWVTIAGGSDNLGNHTATQTIVLGSNFINGDSTASEGLSINSSGQVSVQNAVNQPMFSVISNSNGSDYLQKIDNNNNNKAYLFFENTGSTGSIEYLGNLDNRLVFGTESSERMTIDSSGNVGIGTSTPGYKMDVQGSVSAGSLLRVWRNWNTDGANSLEWRSDTNNVYWKMYQPASSNNLLLESNSVTNVQFWNVSTGLIGMGTNSPGARLDVTDTSTTTSGIIVPRAGNFTGTNVNGMIRYNTTSNLFEFRQNNAWVNYTTVSDGRLKTNIEPVTNGLEIVNQLNPVFYDWDRSNPRTYSFGDRHEVGFIAQEVEKVLPEVVNAGGDGYRSLEYGKVVAVVVDAVKTLYQRILGLEQQQAKQDRKIATIETDNDANAREIQKLKQENAELKARLDKIEKLLNSK